MRNFVLAIAMIAMAFVAAPAKATDVPPAGPVLRLLGRVGDVVAPRLTDRIRDNRENRILRLREEDALRNQRAQLLALRELNLQRLEQARRLETARILQLNARLGRNRLVDRDAVVVQRVVRDRFGRPIVVRELRQRNAFVQPLRRERIVEVPNLRVDRDLIVIRDRLGRVVEVRRGNSINVLGRRGSVNVDRNNGVVVRGNDGRGVVVNRDGVVVDGRDGRGVIVDRNNRRININGNRINADIDLLNGIINVQRNDLIR